MSDPIRDQSDRPENRDDRTYSAAGGDSFSGNPAGAGYTTPTGGYGYAYSPEPERGTGGGKRALVILAVALVAALLGGCVALGGLLVREGDPEAPSEGACTDRPTDTEPVTKSGSFIVIDPFDTEPDRVTEAVTALNTEACSVATVPLTATVKKKSPARTDADGDGKADIALDGNGYVITSAGDNILPAATVAYRVADSVVEIGTETITRSGWLGQYVTSGAGSGVIISEEGFIVTNHHVIEGADSITVRLSDGTTYPARLIGTDEQTDIALLWINAEGKKLTVATMGASFDLVVGEGILAIGNPLGSLGGTVTEGIISATERSIQVGGTVMTLLQISSPISPGNSGGGLFNMAGELVGVVNAKMSETDVEGLGFAIPIDTAYAVITELYGYGYVRGRPAVGVTLVDVTSSWTALQYFSSRYTGVYVYGERGTDGAETVEGENTEPDSPLRYGDLLVSVAGIKVSSVSEVNAVIRDRRVGDELTLVVYRNGETLTLTVPLVEYVPDKPVSQD